MTKRPVLAAMLLAAAVPLAGCGVNAIPTAEENAKARMADLQSAYQRRNDLIPNLVSTVKAASAQEKATIVEVTQARAGAAQSHLSADDLKDPARVEAYQKAQNAVQFSLQRLQEAYPDLKSQANYGPLMSQLEGSEDRINIARRDYNGAVQSYNTRIRTFPDAIGARIFYGAKPLVPFTAAPGAEVAPTVNFGNAS